MTLTERAFRLTYDDEPSRIVRGCVTLPREHAAPVVLIVHGFMGFMEWGFFPLLARRIAESGLVAVRFDLSGSGVGEDGVDFSAPQNLEHDTPSRSLEDLARVRAFVECELPNVDATRIGLVGHSRGGALALLHACERPDTRAVVTWNAISSFERWDETVRRDWRRDGHLAISNGRTRQVFRLSTDVLDDLDRNRARLDVAARCRGLALPVLLMQADADEAVAPASVDELARALMRAETRVEHLPATGHTFGARHPLVEVPPELERALDTTVAFLRSRLEGNS
jgi:uncharacterized protein